MARRYPENIWSKKDTEALISIFKRYPVLYDCSLKNDSLTLQRKEHALQEVMAQLIEQKSDVTVTAIKQKIRTLRGQMTSELKCIWKARDSGQSYLPKLWCYDQLTFLLQPPNEDDEDNSTMEVYEVLDSPSTDSAPEVSESDLTTNGSLPPMLESVPLPVPQPEVADREHTPYNGQVTIEAHPVKSNAQTDAKRQKRDQPNIDTLIHTAAKSLEIMQSICRNAGFGSTRPSKATLFCKYLCSELDELEETYDGVKHEIIELVMNAKSKERALKRSRGAALNTVDTDGTTYLLNNSEQHATVPHVGIADSSSGGFNALTSESSTTTSPHEQLTRLENSDIPNAVLTAWNHTENTSSTTLLIDSSSNSSIGDTKGVDEAEVGELSEEVLQDDGQIFEEFYSIEK